jgi:IS5 family transposase
MKPEKTRHTSQMDFVRMELKDLIDRRHELVKLALQMNWQEFEEDFGATYKDFGRPGVPTRLMAGLHYLKWAYDLSDEEVVARWVENPYWQYFCGRQYFEHKAPIDSSSMTHWRKRIGVNGAENLFRETVQTAIRRGYLKKKDCEKVIVDTTVQTKAIRFPTDARLYNRMRERLVKAARSAEIDLRQTYERVGPQLLRKQQGYGHAKQYRRSAGTTKKLKTILGRVVRDIERKGPDASGRFSGLLTLAHRLLEQERDSKNKLYSVHEPQVECIAKGKAHRRYEFGNKVGFVLSARKNWIVGVKSFLGNPYDGHTLKDNLQQGEQMTDVKIVRAVCDLGYRGHDVNNVEVSIVPRKKKGAPEAIRRLWRRRNAIEPIIGHEKAEHRLERNRLAGELGDQLNAVMAACGFNIKKLLRAFCAVILEWLEGGYDRPMSLLTVGRT